MRYASAECGMIREIFDTKEEALNDIAERNEREKVLHELHPDWSWANYHLMVEDEGDWRMAKTHEYKTEEELDKECFEERFGDILNIREKK